MEPIQYRSFTIKEDFNNPYKNVPSFMFFLTKDGEQHDADYDGEGYKYCGNCKWADSIEECQEMIDELLTETI